MEVTDFISGNVEYDKFGGQYFWIKMKNGGSQMLAEMRGWGHIQNMFVKNGKITEEEAGKFQDKVGDWIAEAINEKLEREKDRIKQEIKIIGVDWTEDFSHENGNYQNRCICCSIIFTGHKRRKLCYECHNKK